MKVGALLPIMIIVTLTFFSPLRHSFASFRTLYGVVQKGEAKILERENRVKLYEDCLKFLKTRVDLDLALFKDDIWSH